MRFVRTRTVVDIGTQEVSHAALGRLPFVLLHWPDLRHFQSVLDRVYKDDDLQLVLADPRSCLLDLKNRMKA